MKRNVWKGPYNRLFRQVSKYAVKYGLPLPVKVAAPTYENIEALRALQQTRVQEQKELRESKIFDEIKREYKNIVDEVAESTGWSTMKKFHLFDEIDEAFEKRRNDKFWLQWLEKESTKELFRDLVDTLITYSEEQYDWDNRERNNGIYKSIDSLRRNIFNENNFMDYSLIIGGTEDEEEFYNPF